jgi:hypothetical protein
MRDVDATLTTAYSDKEHAKGNFKGGYGHHPLLCYLDGSGEALAGVLRPGNAGSNTAADHTTVLELALEQLDPIALEGEILVRADGAGASHELTGFCRDGAMRFSFGFDLDERVRDAIAAEPEAAWQRAIRADGTQREHSQVCEITNRVDLQAWPEGSRLIARKTRLRDGDQLSFADHDGHRMAVFLTDPARRRRPRTRSLPSRPRPRRGPHPPRQGLRPGQPAVSELRSQPSMAVARDARPGPSRLDPSALPSRRRPRLGTQTAALPTASPVRTDRPPRPTHDATPRPRLALVRTARSRLRAPPSAPRARHLTGARAPPPTTAAPDPAASACPQTAPAPQPRPRDDPRPPAPHPDRADQSPHSPTRTQNSLSQAGFHGDLDSRILSSGEETLRRHGPSKEVSARVA